MKNLKNQYNFEDLDDEDIEEAYWEELDKQRGSVSSNFVPNKGKQSPFRHISEEEYKD